MAGRGGHESFFTYSISRPYPLRWFTPVTVTGGIIFTVLISFANFVASGYELTTIYANDPSTIDQDLWFKKWPSWLRNNINATCEAADLPVNSQLFTNKLALAYTLTNISVEQDNGTIIVSPSLPYLNNELRQCEIQNISMEFDCAKTGVPILITKATCRIDVRAFTTCEIDGPNGHTTFSSSSVYNPYLGYASPGSSDFIQPSKFSSTNINLWWAQQLLKTYWLDTDIVVWENIANDTQPYNVGRGIQQGVANFYRHHQQNDIGQLDFFDAWYEFNGLDDGTYYNGRKSVKEFIEEANVASTFGPPIWKQADRFAKSMYSAVMTDLGQTAVPNVSNILTNPDVLRTYAERFSPLHSMDYITGIPTLYDQLPDGDYDSLRAGIGAGPLEVTPSVISTIYLCSVPQMKSAGNLFISILLADLVFLNALWFLYCLVVDRYFVRSPTANYCEGCLSGHDDVHPLRDLRKSNASSIPSLYPAAIATETFSTGYEPLQFRRTDSQESLVERRSA